MKLLALDIIFTKLSTKTLFLWRRRVSFEYQGLLQNTPASFLLLFCQCSSFVVNGITEIQQHIAGVQHNVNTSRKRRRRDADIRSAAAAAARRSVTIGGGGVSKMSAAAAAHSSTAGAPRFLCKRWNWCVCESWQRLKAGQVLSVTLCHVLVRFRCSTQELICSHS